MKHHVRTRLTPKRETFAQLVARGESASGAYRTHYDARKMTPKSVNEAASRLAQDRKVTARVAELRAPALLEAQYAITVDLNRTFFENARVGFSDIRKLFGPGDCSTRTSGTTTPRPPSPASNAWRSSGRARTGSARSATRSR